MPQDRVRRRLLQMFAGMLVGLGFLAIIGSGGELLPMLFVTLVMGGPAMYLLFRSTTYYDREIDGFEAAAMMGVGALVFLFVTVSVASLQMEVVALSALLFAAPAAVLWIITNRRQTQDLSPV